VGTIIQAGTGEIGTGSAAAKNYLKTVPKLPSPPTLVVELLTVLKQPDIDLDRVLELIAYDPALSGELLKRANSAAHLCDQPVVDVGEAIARIGFYETYCILVAYLGSKFGALSGAGETLDLEHFWRHSALTAVTASVLADAIGESKSAAFITGLLHDVGKLIFAATDPARYASALNRRAAYGPFLADTERTVFGVDHPELAACLLADWKLPEYVTVPVRYHHRVQVNQPYGRLTAITHAADIIAHWLDEHPDEPDSFAVDDVCLEVMEISRQELDPLVPKALKSFESVKDLLHI
jgi:HD-like signal output (HDOD) protein